MITQNRLKQILDYDPDTGKFTWLIKKTGIKRREAGHTRTDGQVTIGINGANYRAHRLVWLYVYGYFPENQIDHINRNPSDNRLCNLREVNQACNMANASKRTDNTSGIRGVATYGPRYPGKWYAMITRFGKNHYLGSTYCKLEAACLRYAAEQCLDILGCDANSSAGTYIRNNI